jgi:hypothetical protein
MKKEKKTKNQKKIVKKTRKKEKTTQKTHLRRVNGPAQRRTHACGVEFHPGNGRSIGIAPSLATIDPEVATGSERSRATYFLGAVRCRTGLRTIISLSDM